MGFMVSGCGINTSPGSGTKVGQIVKVSCQGMLFKTTEAELIRGGMTGGSGVVGMTPFDFTVPDKFKDQVQKAMETQEEVVITYSMDGFWWNANSESEGHFLTGIQPAPKDK
jgi:hypothetical protein